MRVGKSVTIAKPDSLSECMVHVMTATSQPFYLVESAELMKTTLDI